MLLQIRHIGVVILSFFFLSLGAQTPYVKVKLDTNSILIGEQTSLNLSVLHANTEDSIQFPFYEDTLQYNIEVIEYSEVNVFKSDELIKHSINLTITSFDSGYYAIRPLKVKVNNAVLESEPLLLEVRNVTLDSLNLAELQLSDVNDIKDIYDDPFTLSEFIETYGVKILLGSCSLAVLAYLSWLLFFRKAEEKPILVEKEKVPSHIIAMDRLNKINAEEIWQAGKDKRYHSEVTDTLRSYLEERFNIHAMEQTSEEIIRQMKYADIESSAKNHLVRMLRLADMVKFAKEKPGSAENIATMEMAMEFVELTIEKEVHEQ